MFAEEFLVDSDSLCDLAPSLRRERIETATLMNSAHHGGNHVEAGLVRVGIRHGIRPNCQLLRQDGCRRAHHYRRQLQIILLVGHRLDMQAAEHRVVHAPPTAAAVFNDQVAILLQDGIEPLKVRTVMFEQALPEAFRVYFGPLQRVDVIVHFDIANAVLIHQAFDNLVEVAPDFGIAKIK